MNFEWEDFTLQFIEIESYFSDISHSTDSIDCILGRDSALPGIYFKNLVFSVFPFFLCALIGLWSHFNFLPQERKSKFLIVALISLDLIIPSIINIMIESITCFEFEGVYYLRKDMSYQCYTKDHLSKVNFCFPINLLNQFKFIVLGRNIFHYIFGYMGYYISSFSLF